MESEFTPEERTLLAEVLEERHRELQWEIIHTDAKDYREMLRQRDAMVERLLNRMHVTAA